MNNKKIWTTDFTIEMLNKGSENTMVDHLGILFTKFGDDYIEAKMPVDQRTKQPFGLLHGGASVTLCESLGSMASNLCINTTTHYSVGLTINASHIRSATSGYVTAVCKPVHLGRTTHIWDINCYNESGKITCQCKLTTAVLAHKR